MQRETKKPKRMLVLNYEWPPLGGGASPVSYELAKRLSETGEFDIDVVTMRYKDLLAYEELNDHLRVHRVRSLRSKKELCHPWEQATYLVSGYFKCRELITQKPYDICHTHFIIPTGVLARRLKKEFGLPYVLTAHGSDVLGYNARFKKLYQLLVGTWKGVLDDATTITSPSNFLKGEIVKIYPSIAEKIVVIPNGIDLEKFTPQAKENYIFSSGRLLVNKGFQYIIQAVSDEDIGWEVHIAGDGPMRAELEALAKNSKTKIVFHGWLDNNGEEYKNLLERAAIFVLLSEAESFGMVIVEAMSAGCAIISSDVSGCAEIVGADGILVDRHDTHVIADCIKGLIENDIQRRDFQEFSRKNKKYDWLLILKEFMTAL